MSINFKEFPLSYRISQSGIVLAIAGGFIAAKFVRQNMPPIIAIVVGSVIGSIVLGSLIVSQYVIIRYPFLSLIETKDDYFAKQISAGSRLYPILRWITMLMLVLIIGTMFLQPIRDFRPVIVIVYGIFMLGFLMFMTFKYDPVTHPTVATYIRSTIGIGILLFPLFLPALIVGSFRCRRLLEAQEFAAMMDGNLSDSQQDYQPEPSTFDARLDDH